MKLKKSLFLTLVSASALTIPHTAQAASVIWDGSDSTNYETGANYVGNTVPVAGDDLQYYGAPATNLNVSLTATSGHHEVGSVTFLSSATSAVTVSGNSTNKLVIRDNSANASANAGLVRVEAGSSSAHVVSDLAYHRANVTSGTTGTLNFDILASNFTVGNFTSNNGENIVSKTGAGKVTFTTSYNTGTDIQVTGGTMDFQSTINTQKTLTGSAGTTVTNSGLTTRTLELRSNQASGYSGAVTGNLNLKRGRSNFNDNSTTILDGDTDTYTGTTTVSTGTLLVNAMHTGGGNYSVTGGISGAGASAEGILGGTGTINNGGNAVTIGDGTTASRGVLTGGASGAIGGLSVTTSSLGFLSDGVLRLELNSLAGNSNDLIALIGAMNIDAAAVLELPTLGGFNAATFFDGTTYTLLTNTGTRTGTFALDATAASLLTTNNYEVQYNSNSIQLAMIPEPSSVALLLAGATGLFLRRRRK